MGREKKILLGLLGLLAGVFVGVLSAKLLVPRPPAGTGPDIRSESAIATAQERVEPPAPAPRSAAGGWDFAAAPPLVPDVPEAPDVPVAPPAEPPRFGRFAPAPVEPPADGPLAPPAERALAPDDSVAPVSWQRVDPPEAPPVEAARPADPPPAEPRGETLDPPARDPFAAPRAVPVAGDYVVQAGDSWWGVAERAYGDGRLYRALFAWNRARDPRVALAPGTRLDVPPLARLAAAWPRLLPAGAGAH